MFDFEESDDLIEVSFVEVDSNFKIIVFNTMVDGKLAKGIIKNSFHEHKSKNEVVDLYRKSTGVIKSTYGYNAYIKEDGRVYKIFLRFGNITTARSIDVFEFIEVNWEKHFKRSRNFNEI